MWRRSTLTRAVPAALAVAAALAGCGGGSSGSNGVASQSASQIVATATRALQSLSSVHVVGGFSEGASTRVTIDLHLVAGKGAVGSMSENGTAFRLVVIGSQVYINGAAGFWRQYGGSVVADRLAGRWIKGSSQMFGGLAAELRLPSLLSGLLGSHGGLVKGAVSTIGARKVIAVHDPSKDGTLYVATTGKPYAIELLSGTRDGKVTFFGFDAPVTLAAPADSAPAQQFLK